jgi:transposase-like protein
MKRRGRLEALVTDKLRPSGATLREISGEDLRATKRWESSRAENPHRPARRRERPC